MDTCVPHTEEVRKVRFWSRGRQDSANENERSGLGSRLGHLESASWLMEKTDARRPHVAAAIRPSGLDKIAALSHHPRL